ncbi:MAG: polymer-forming cytoskeletal protein [Anaerolineaceae bacterium]|nr:polymer-forming cytoskeletal protein [Anaerolineaceae bacterium]
MKSSIKVILLVVLAMLVLPTTVLASNPGTPPQADKVVFGGTYTLASNDTLDGNLAVFGGSATVEKNATVTGDVVLAGGSLSIDGQVNGNVSALGGSIFLGDTAVVQGDVTTMGAALHRGANTRIMGKVINGFQGPFQVNVPEVTPAFRLGDTFKPLVDVLWFFFRTLALAALAMLLVLFLPNPTERIGQSILAEPVTAGGLGLLTVIIAPILVVVLAITILLIPVSLLAVFLLIIAGLFGWIAVGTEVGKRIAQMFKGGWPLAVSAGIGTFVISLVAGAMNVVPCVGWVGSALVSMLGLGGVILTRFGTIPYPTTPAYPVAPSSPGDYSPRSAPIPPAPHFEPATSPEPGPQIPPSDQA